MSLLRTEMEQEETILIELLNSECKSECVSACDKLRSSLALNLLCNIEGCDASLSSGNKPTREYTRHFKMSSSS
ncbi:hypothetical protein AQUCO_12000014v1 [Aquilegia coerulea]|uniref:Uncharacterized protein n=1 Tax=Aquilegia coerulea TaxID=218851 RepID=A0A2G5C1U7_AQUCA|nr:hypothetical protein AQUCO_12000014v1 [Aquilegia coerulea]